MDKLIVCFFSDSLKSLFFKLFAFLPNRSIYLMMFWSYINFSLTEMGWKSVDVFNFAVVLLSSAGNSAE